jgi:hypothetical protein
MHSGKLRRGRVLGCQKGWLTQQVEKALAEEKDQKTLNLFPIRLDGAVLKAKDD